MVTKRGRHYKNKSERTKKAKASARPMNPINDDRPCTYCDQKLWQHPRCAGCGRFIWCGATGQHAECGR